ncbi:enoyl-CoA hydratase/isomerase family protein [Amycolatopsis aidingensis]|uniref:enoyl-CoA hydratase/isomerase family protein n=1 Tax=Amycolatopsis aidingensis TaxID=2842453 RepID=UPI001C0D3F07|nr:enoyl-CoA hydratase/isomerase family protein [Amycolatopsis aidingensis]
MSEQLIVRIDGTVATAIFNRPAARNAMTWAMYDGLVEFCDRVEAEPGVRVAVLRGAGGKAFVAGTDIGQFQDFRDAEDGIEYERRIDSVLDRLERLDVPTIAAVDGHAIGGGLAIAAACDLRVCTRSATFGVPIARTIGNCLSMRNYARLVDLIGAARTLHLMYTAELLDAEQALAAGLVTELLDDGELDERLNALCARLAGHAPLTLRASKLAIRRLRAAAVPDGDDLVRMCYGSEDFHEGVAAFVRKRPPHWRGR